MGATVDMDDPPVRRRVLHLDPLERITADQDQVVVPVLAVGDRNPVAELEQVGGDLQLGQIALELRRCHTRTLRALR